MSAPRQVLAMLGASLLFAGVARGGESGSPSGELRFLRDGAPVRTLGLAALAKAAGRTTVAVEDPYYKRRKVFLALPLKAVLAAGFGEPISALAGEDVVFHALDGYVKPVPAALLQEDGGYLAFADAEKSGDGPPRWEPIDRRQLDPGPYYVVWTGAEQSEAKGFPWPFQVASIERVDFERRYPLTLPRSATAGSAPWRGFAIFRRECFSCHAINGEGGKIGPDLNVPQSIVEYRPVEQIKAYVRNPETFRYSSMPAHLHLSPGDLDDVVAYFTTMKDLKHDPKKVR